jgi:diguanylate cyclase (GGDEF)-like protein
VSAPPRDRRILRRSLATAALTLAVSILPAAGLRAGASATQAAGQPSKPTPAPSDRGGIGFERPDWVPTRASPYITLHARRTIGGVMLVFAGTLFLLYLFRPKPYVLAWVTAWLAASGALFSGSLEPAGLRLDLPDDREFRLIVGRFMVAVWAFYVLAFSLFLRWGALWFRREAEARLPGWVWWAAAGAAAWLSVSAVWLGLAAVFLPAFILMTLWLARGAVVYLRVYREWRFKGALLAGIGVGGIFLTNTATVAAAVVQQSLGGSAAAIAYVNVVWAALMVLGMPLLVFEDLIDELRHANAELARSRDEMRAMAVTDSLTGCYNRRFLSDVERHELEQHRRFDMPLSLLFVDCDRFKAINDTRGHETGDRVLRTIGDVLRAQTRQSDYVFRWGGDEFLVLLSADEARAIVKADDIRRAFRASPIVAELPDGVDLSIGCVPVPRDAQDLGPLIEQADREMYRNKRVESSRVES